MPPGPVYLSSTLRKRLRTMFRGINLCGAGDNRKFSVKHCAHLVSFYSISHELPGVKPAGAHFTRSSPGRCHRSSGCSGRRGCRLRRRVYSARCTPRGSRRQSSGSRGSAPRQSWPRAGSPWRSSSCRPRAGGSGRSVSMTVSPTSPPM